MLVKTRFYQPKILENFLCLSTALIILLNPSTCVNYQDYARDLLETSVENFGKLYGHHLISHNVHGMLHLADDVTTYGALDECSVFHFENFMQKLKSSMRKHHLPLQQIYKRPPEQAANSEQTEPIRGSIEGNSFTCEHEAGPLANGCTNPQHKTLQTPKFQISCNFKDSFCLLTNKTIVRAKRFAFSSSEKKLC